MYTELGAPPPGQIRVLCANTIMWGIYIDGQETPMTLAANERTEDLAAALGALNPDIACLSEQWSKPHAERLAAGLRNSTARLGHVASGPFIDGPNKIYGTLRGIHPRVGDVGKKYASRIIQSSFAADNHTLAEDIAMDLMQGMEESQAYMARALAKIKTLPRELKRKVVEILKELGSYAMDEYFKDTYVFGSGLQVHTRENHPIVDSKFEPHPKSAGVERLSHKGSLVTTTLLNGKQKVTVVDTHLSHGASALARAVRRDQLAHIKAMTAAIKGPLILVGDLNIIGDTDEYDEMMQLLGFIDCYRKLHPNAKTHPGHTLIGGNEYALRFGMAGVDMDERLDYVLIRDGEGLHPVFAEVMADHFRARTPNPDNLTQISDHLPLVANIAHD